MNDSSLPPQRSGFTKSLIFLAIVVFVSMAVYQIRDARQQRTQELERYYRVPEFTLISEEGKPVSLEDLKGKIWVADFIFTNCQGPCPVISARMMEIQNEIKRSGVEGIQLVSISVDPERDTPEVLAEYAKKYHASPYYWTFLTGDTEEVDQLVEGGFKQALVRQGRETDPDHGTQFAIVDGEGIIRAFHEGTTSKGVQGVLTDLGKLVREREK